MPDKSERQKTIRTAWAEAPEKKCPFFYLLKAAKKMSLNTYLSQVKFALDPFNSALNRNQNLTLILKVFFFFVLHAGGAAVLMA